MSPKAKSLLLNAYKSQREFCSFDPVIEREVIALGYGQYTQKPMMKLSFDGRKWAAKEAAKRG